MVATPKPQERRPGFSKRGYTFGTGGMPMPPGGGDPAQALRGAIASAPPKARAKVKKLIAGKLKDALRAKQAGGAPMPPMTPPGPAVPPMPPPGMKRGGAVRGVGAARKGGGRGRIV